MTELTPAELELCRQWFCATQDLSHPDYLKTADYVLAEKLYVILGMRVPNRITEKLVDVE